MNEERDSVLRWRPDLWARLKPLVQEKRKKPTPAEQRLWLSLRNSGVGGFKFRRQHTMEPFIVDFYCAEARLVVEVDGPIHDTQVEEDRFRQEMLEACGLTVIRFTNEEVQTKLGVVLTSIRDVARAAVAIRVTTKSGSDPTPA